MEESLSEIVKNIYSKCPFCNDGTKYYLTCTKYDFIIKDPESSFCFKLTK